jgi:hypothetical protein
MALLLMPSSTARSTAASKRGEDAPRTGHLALARDAISNPS